MALNVRELCPELKKIAEEEQDETPQKMIDSVEHLKDWIAKQPFMNARTDDQWLVSFLRGCKYRLEFVKERMDNLYAVKSAFPQIFGRLEVSDENTQKLMRSGIFCALPFDEPRKGVLIIVRPKLVKTMDDLVNLWHRFIYMLVCFGLMNDDVPTVAGLTIVVDASGIQSNISNLMPFYTPSNMKLTAMLGDNCIPLRLNGLHMINMPSTLDTIAKFAMSLVRKKVRSRVQFHSTMEDVFKIIPQKYFPKDYGGEQPSCSELANLGADVMSGFRDWFLEDEKHKSDESRRPGKPKDMVEHLGIQGSFRKLEVD